MLVNPSSSTLVPVALALLLGTAATAQQKARPAPKAAKKPEAETAGRTYPKPPLSDQTDDYHGTKIPDPYRGLENPDTPETRAWIEAENKITESFLASAPERAAIKKRLTALWNFERYTPPVKEGGRYFFTKNNGLQNQAVLYVLDKLGGTPRLLLDPNGLSRDGTVALAGWDVSRDGKKLAYGIATAGSDWNEWHVLDVDTGANTPDVLKWVKFSNAAWTPDGKGFYYSRYDAPAAGQELEAVNKNQKLYYHVLLAPQSEDALVYERPDEPEWGFSPAVSDDGKYLVVTVWKGTDRRNRLYVKDLEKPGDFIKLFDDFDAAYQFVDNDGALFYVKTDLVAPRGRIVAYDLKEAGQKERTMREIVPQTDVVITSASGIGDRLVVQVSKDATERARIYTFDGALEKEIPLPALGTLGGFAGKRKDTETFYAFTSFTYPTTIFRYDFTTGKSTELFKPKVDLNPGSYETHQFFFASKDGTQVPIFIVNRKGLKRNGQAPTYLYGYGGFNVPMTPTFWVRNLAFLEMGGVYALACLRGGSEYGETWHEAGMLKYKQKVFDDFAAAAEFLIKYKYTSPAKLAIGGGSNGGLLVGAVLNQHPELFGAAVPAVGVMDMLRFHKFTIGWAWVSEYGSSDDPEQFKWLHKYSPLHNIRKGETYPPVLVITADHDDRVVPAHSFKYAATLQAAQGGPAPILIRIETRAGHGAGKPTTKLIEEATDVLAFLAKTLGGLKPVD